MLKIKELRNKNNDSQSKLASILGVSLRTVQNYEAEKVIIPSDKLNLIAQHYAVSAEYILGKKEETSIKNPIVFLKKEGVKFELEEIRNHIIDNEEHYFNDRMFRLWLNDHINKALKKICEENGIKVTYTSKK